MKGGNEMSDVQELLQARALPAIFPPDDSQPAATWVDRRAQMLDLLRREMYGFSPAAVKVRVEELSRDDCAFGGKAMALRWRLGWDTPGGPFAFPVDVILPHGNAVPVFVHISFLPEAASALCPLEEMLDRGMGVASFCYNDVTRDQDDGFSSGLAALYPEYRGSDGWGKIAMWAYAASRVLDALLELKQVDPKRTAVVGHSRLGKTALWCGANDERFALVCSNDSGCGGAALSRGKVGEDIERITRVFPHWFCGNYRAWAGREDEAPFDQHFLLAACAPRKVAVASAVDDEWADPVSEFLCCAAASAAYEALGLNGLVHGGTLPQVGDTLQEGSIGYHLRAGGHFLSRYDWNRFVDFLLSL